ncbi:MAG TPA: hypothetical protein DEA40_00850 [Parvularcula sp.]|nr:hypothetical protein [Parvularcula sp.]HBS34412.1 hypothetical protein [Parvularcula sp.]
MNTFALADPKAQSLDDVMLAMDVVDTLRHRELVLAKELGGEERKAALIARLKEIYSAQGIEVPDAILEDGVKALEEKRFVYDPPTDSFQRRLATAYIRRGRWAPPILFVAGAAAFLTAAYEFGFERPREAAAERTRIELTVTLPQEMAAARDAALALAADEMARRRVETAYQDGVTAVEQGAAATARKAVEDLGLLRGDLAADLTIRVVSGPNSTSGVARDNVARPGAENFYLIVEAVDASGRPHPLEIESQEDRRTARAAQWGVQVPEGEFLKVAADKQDDLIVQDDAVGAKPRGTLTPRYDVPTEGGAILEW